MFNKKENTMNTENRTIGLEIEAYNIDPQSLTNELNRQGIPTEFSHSHMTTSADKWVVKRDGSLHGLTNAFELVSPPMKYNFETYDVLARVCTVLNVMGAKVNKQCGLHVHVYVGDMKFKKIKNIALRYTKFEDVIDYFMPKSRRSDYFVAEGYSNGRSSNHAQYAVSTRTQSNGTPVTMVNQTMQKIKKCRNMNKLQYTMSNNRYCKVNFQSWNKYKTVEFRQHSGTTELVKIWNWVKFVHRMVEVSNSSSSVKMINPNKKVLRNILPRADIMFKGLNINDLTLADVKVFYKKRMKHFISKDGQSTWTQERRVA
jgi:hypothetical protein